VQRLRLSGMRVFLATNQEHRRARHLMETMGLKAYVDGMLYSAALAPWLRGVPVARRAVMAHLLTDEAYALTIAHFRRLGWADTRGYWIAAIAVTFIPWNLATLAGVLLGGQIPDPSRFGIDIIIGEGASFTCFLKAVHDGDFSAERFRFVDELQQKMLDHNDRLVNCSYIAFRDYDLWNACRLHSTLLEEGSRIMDGGGFNLNLYQ